MTLFEAFLQYNASELRVYIEDESRPPTCVAHSRRSHLAHDTGCRGRRGLRVGDLLPTLAAPGRHTEC